MEPQETYGFNPFEKLSFAEKLKEVYDINSDFFLSENLFNIEKDIDYIYDNFFENILTKYKQNPQRIYNAIINNVLLFNDVISSAELLSEVSKEAHNKNPIKIFIGILPGKKNSYSPVLKRITLSPNTFAMKFLGETGLNALPNAIKTYPLLKNEFLETSIKGTIVHELSHWINDSLHNKNIEKILKKINNIHSLSKYSPVEWEYTSVHEIDANIHVIAELKRLNEDNWDNLTFSEILVLKPSLIFIFKEIATKTNKKHYYKFVKRFFSRLARENLIGKNLRPLPYEDAKKLK